MIPTAESAGRMLALSLTSPIAGHLVEDLLESNTVSRSPSATSGPPSSG